MSVGLSSTFGSELLQKLTPIADGVIRRIDALRFDEAHGLLQEATDQIDAVQHPSAEAAVLNDLFILRLRFQLLSQYSELWERIIQGRFSDSWNSLQNALDSMRAIKRLSRYEFANLEFQLRNLEIVYPYRLFFSVGMVASRIECSICGNDIDSHECEHRQGFLYAGRMACGIIRDCRTLDHVSLVENPFDKRCVVTISDTSPQFELIRYIGHLLSDRKIIVSEFKEVVFERSGIPNPSYRRIGRNDSCFCGSGQKFKVCCIGKSTVEHVHAEVIVRRAVTPASKLTAIK